MKVLFVCQGNVGRSQYANAYFEGISSHLSTCAGTRVNENDGQVLGELAKDEDVNGLTRNVIEAIAADGVDISSKIRRQVTPGMIDDADRIIVMAEQETWPDFLKHSDKVEVWSIIADASKLNYEGLCEIRDQIKGLVTELVQQVEG